MIGFNEIIPKSATETERQQIFDLLNRLGKAKAVKFKEAERRIQKTLDDLIQSLNVRPAERLL